MKNIEAKKIELKDLLSRDYFYRVPEYQRPYSWDEEHFIDLIQDLLDAKRDQEYFFGTIVVHKKDGVNNIVDGQQRLTTIMILLASLRDLIEDDAFKNSIQEKIIQKENVVDGIPEKIRIEVKDRETFNELVVPLNGTNNKKDGEKLQEPQWRYVKAIEVFKGKLEPLSQKELQSFTQFLSQNCVMILLSTNTFEDAFKLFTIVNDRGKQLRRIDILKANNISPVIIKSEAVRNSLSQKWEEWEKTLGGETFENILFLMRYIILGEKPQYDLLVEFEEKIFKKNLIQKGEKFIDLVCEYSSLYNDIFEDYSYFDGSPNKNTLIGLIFIMDNEFRSNEWKAMLMLYLKKFKLLSIERFLYQLELKYLEGWLGGYTKDIRTILFGNIIKQINSATTAEEVFAIESFKVNTQVILNELKGELYNKNYCKYILCRLELLASENDVEKKIKAKSVEHILPQTLAQNSQWVKDFNVEQRNLWTNKLANLVLLSKAKNSSASNYDFTEKKQRYLQTRISDYPRSIEVLRNDKWTPEVLEKRQTDLLKIVLQNIFKV